MKYSDVMENAMTVVEVSQILDMHAATVSRYCRHFATGKPGGLPAYRDLKNRWMVTPDDLENWIEQRYYGGRRGRRKIY